ncbi:hypothetical protein DFH09DRAFT_1178379 [Mycena vulgaris]|nr:hypothetical protein DFH09DRAFT_1178379 [Mycena vulgaris]
MTVPTTRRFLLTIDNGNHGPQLVSINVIVSLEGDVHIDASSENTAISLTEAPTTVDLRTGGDVVVGGPNRPIRYSSSSRSDAHLPLIDASGTGANLGLVGSAPLSTPDVSHAGPGFASTATPAPHSPPAYSPGTPPPAYSYATPASMPAIPPNPALNQAPPIAPPAALATLQIPLPIVTPAVQVVQTRVRRRALAEQRRFVPPSVPPPVAEGPGLLSALLAVGLELLPLKRRADTHVGGRYKRRRL